MITNIRLFKHEPFFFSREGGVGLLAVLYGKYYHYYFYFYNYFYFNFNPDTSEHCLFVCHENIVINDCRHISVICHHYHFLYRYPAISKDGNYDYYYDPCKTQLCGITTQVQTNVSVGSGRREKLEG